MRDLQEVHGSFVKTLPGALPAANENPRDFLHAVEQREVDPPGSATSQLHSDAKAKMR